VEWFGLTSASLIFAAYLIGSTPTAYLAVRLLKGQDIRRLGDGNAGAGNVFRIIGSRVGIVVATVDIGKGAAAVLLVRGLLDSTAAEMIAGVAAVAGHNWPVHLYAVGVRGGRGAAAAVGVLMVMFPALVIPLSIVALGVLYFIKSAIKALGFFFISLPFISLILVFLAPMGNRGYSYPLLAYSVGIPVMVGLSHYLSLKRLPPPQMPHRGGESASEGPQG
jgi:glycerol-3-phosphate acyltransferase PlsY